MNLRVDKYISNGTDLSRTDVKRIIRKGLVAIDDKQVSNPAQQVISEQIVTIEGSPIKLSEHRYFMMNKPLGVISADKDHHHSTAIDLIFEHRSKQLQIAGRLDIDTTGLILITDDGQWNHRLTAPRSSCAKRYHVELAEPVGNHYQDKLATGIYLQGEKRRCLPAIMEVIDDFHVNLSICEGKYHQVKRMFVAMGNQVVSLHRYQVGDIVLDEHLQPGDYRPLTEAEVNSV